jgi:hypothetical protein
MIFFIHKKTRFHKDQFSFNQSFLFYFEIVKFILYDVKIFISTSCYGIVDDYDLFML